MDKRIILAVAGSGKTTHIINSIDLSQRNLILTYTINNATNLRQGIIKRFGYFPNNIDLSTYYPFLHSFCFKPFMAYILRTKGICWEIPPAWTNMKPRDDLEFYLTSDKRIYHNRIAKILETFEVLDDIRERMLKYYDWIYVDEVQDFAGHDFNLLKHMLEWEIDYTLVGDFYQHTFDTSRDGNVNKNLHNDYEKYMTLFKRAGTMVDTTTLVKSYRCSPTICDFVSSQLGIIIESHRQDRTILKLIDDQEEVDNIYKDPNIIKLFLKEHYKYGCYSRNWGDCKGENHYVDVCVVLNKTSLDHYNESKLKELKPVTKNKLYVACTRAKNHLYLIPEVMLKKYKK